MNAVFMHIEKAYNKVLTVKLSGMFLKFIVYKQQLLQGMKSFYMETNADVRLEGELGFTIKTGHVLCLCS